MKKPVLEINTESIGKNYIDPQSADVIIEMITAMKKRVANAEELLKMLERVPETEKNQ